MTPSPQLLKAVRDSRMDIAHEYGGLCSELDFQTKFKLSFKQHPLLWLGGAAGAGLLTTLLGLKKSPRRQTAKQPSPSPAPDPQPGQETAQLTKIGWMAGVLEIGKLLYPILRPLVLEFAQKTVQNTFAKRK